MQRCGSGLLLIFAITFVLPLTGCLGKSTSNSGSGGVTSVTLSPGSVISMDIGGIQVFNASAKDALGRVVLGVEIQFIVESGSPGAAPLSVASNGAACAGTWDPSASMCTAGTPGIAYVRAVTSGVSSPQATVYVHQHIDSIQISPITPPGPPQQQYDCFSQGQFWDYQASAYSVIGGNNIDITSTVGPINWSSQNFSVVTLTSGATVPTLQPNQVRATAKVPGITQLFANASGTTSPPYQYTTCLIQSIHLQIGGQAQGGNSITLNNGGGVSITATAVDTLYQVALTDNAALASPPLTWSTSNPEVIAFTNTTNTSGTNSATARANLGGATITASCTPPNCNIGVFPALPIYASDGLLPDGSMGYGAISVDVTSTSTSKLPIYTAWAATTDCQNATGCLSAMFAVTPGATPIGNVVSLPRTPNSMMFNHQSSPRVYLGSNQGLMFVDVTSASPSVSEVSNLPTPCNVSLCGQVLTISNDGKLVVVSDTLSTPSQVYIYNAGSSGSTPVDLVIPGETATAAAFSPDQLKLFILTKTGRMYVYSTVDSLTSLPIATSVTDVAFSPDGSFAYVAGSPASSVSAFSTCSLPDSGSVDIGSVPTTSTPLKIFPSPVMPPPFEAYGLPPLQNDKFYWATQNILALEPPNIEFLTAEFTQNPILYPMPGEPLQLTCNPPLVLNFTKGTSFNLGQGNFTPIYSQLVNDGAEMILVAQNIPAVLVFNVSDGTTASVPLVGNSYPLSASASTDGSQVFVAACDQYTNNDPNQACASGSVHIVNTCAAFACNVTPALGQGDFQQVPFVSANNPNMCSNQGTDAPICLPNLVAIRPQ